LWEKSLYLAQERLVHLVVDFCSVEGTEGWVVFDAYRRSSLDTVEEVTPALKMVLTGEGKTADSYIERFVLQNKSYYDYIYVVTQDFAQAMTVLDSKILPLSPKDFFKQVELSRQELKKRSSSSSFEFSARITDYIKKELMHKLRKQKN
jgi:predicted RNA-binding protein with PIN domain